MKLLLIVTCIFGFTFIYSQGDTSKTWITFSKEQYKIKYPDNWDIDTSKLMGTEFFIFSAKENDSDKFRENISLIIQDLQGQNIDIDKYAQISEGQIKDIATEAKIYDSKKMNIGKPEYFRMIYGMTQGIFKLKIEQYYFVKNEKAFVITLTTELEKFESFKMIGEKILNSFLLTK